MKEKRHIFLTGFMGAGKTAVGRELSRKLRMDFYDLDREVERAAGLSVADIFAAEGEEGFRERETGMLEILSGGRSPAVISTGGGAVLRKRNRGVMNASGEVFYLRADIGALWKRVRGKKGRPLVGTENPYAGFRELFLRRKDVYESAPHEVFTDDINISEVADKIIAILK